MNARQAGRRSVLGRLGWLVVLGLGLAPQTGCVTNPITGRQQLSLMGKGDLISLARQAVPSQFSSDYGVMQDAQLQSYVTRVGRRLLTSQ